MKTSNLDRAAAYTGICAATYQPEWIGYKANLKARNAVTAAKVALNGAHNQCHNVAGYDAAFTQAKIELSHAEDILHTATCNQILVTSWTRTLVK